jgi:hypothetical protein
VALEEPEGQKNLRKITARVVQHVDGAVSQQRARAKPIRAAQKQQQKQQQAHAQPIRT